MLLALPMPLPGEAVHHSPLLTRLATTCHSSTSSHPHLIASHSSATPLFILHHRLPPRPLRSVLPLEPPSDMHRYRFNGKKGQFRVLAGPNCEQELLDRIQQSIGHLLKAVHVTPVLHNGERLQHHARPNAALDHDWVWRVQGQDDAEADPDVGDVMMEGVVLPPAPVDLPLWEYKVCVQFNDPFSKRPRDWALRLLNQDPLHPLVTACTPLIAGTEEDAVEMMLSEHCRTWGAFTLEQAALVLLLHRRFSSLLDEPQVVETVANHVPLRKVADAQYRRDILGMWKRHFPGEAERLQPRRCDPPLSLPQQQRRAPYMVGWDEWMRTNIHHQQLTPDHHAMRPLLLVGPQTLRTSEWTRSHGPHVYMQGRLDLAYLHDCLADADGAHYLVLDELPWSLLLREEGHCHSVLTNGTFQWYHGRHIKTTTQRLPVIVLKSHLPNPHDPCWSPRGWQHWKPILQIVKLLPHVPLIDECTTAQGVIEEATQCVIEEAANEAVLNADAVTADEQDRHRRHASFLAAVIAAAADSEETTPTSGRSAGSNGVVPMVDVTTSRVRTTRSRSRPPSNADVVGCEKTVEPPASPLKLDFARRIPYGPDSFLYPDAIPVAHRRRLLHVVAAIDYVQMKYRGRDLARQKNFQSDNIAGSFAFYEYTGSVPDVWHLGEWSPELLELRDALRAEIDELINSVVANQYLDHHAEIGHHSDKTPDVQRGTSIWTVSLGETRALELRKLDGSETLVVQLTHGSVFEIGPLTNAAYTHSIPPVPHEVGPRYGLTFRTLASRWLHDEQVALRQPARDGDPWLVQKKAIRLDADGQVILRQDGYPSRRVVHLEPFALDDPSHVQEQDITRLRQRLRADVDGEPASSKQRQKKRARKAERSNKRRRQRK